MPPVAFSPLTTTKSSAHVAPEPRQVLGDRRPAAAAHHVAEEEELHGASHSREPPLVARIGPRPAPHGHSSRRTKVRRQLPPFPLWLAGHAPPKARTVTRLAPWRDQSLVVRFVTAGGAVMLAAMLLIGELDHRPHRGLGRRQRRLRRRALPRQLRLAAQPGARRQRPPVGAGGARAGRGLRRLRHRRAHRLLQDLEAGRPHRARLEPRPHRRSASPRRPSSRRPGAARSAAASRTSTTTRTPPRRRSACRSSRSTRRSTRSGRARSSPSPSSTRSRPTSSATSPTPGAPAGCSSPASSSPAASCSSASCAPAAAPSRGSRPCSRRRSAESRDIAAQNVELRRRAVGASARATAQAERSLRRVSADLHDGPAQYVALAAMRLDSLVPDTEAGRRRGRRRCATASRRRSPRSAPSRAGSRCPNSTGLPLAEVARRAVGGAPASRRAPGRPRLHRPAGPRGRRLAQDLPLPLPAGGAVQRHAPRPRRRRARRRRGRRPTG